MAVLKAWVHVVGRDGATVAFGPGQTPPKWAAVQITNPKAWEDGQAPRTATRGAQTASTAGTDGPDGGTGTPTADPIGGDDPATGGDELPKGNAGRDEWAKYADDNGVAYEPEAGRDAIKDAVEKAAAEKAAAAPSTD